MSAAKDITIYSTTWCAFCKTEKQYLDKLGYSYTEKDIEADKEAYDELMEKIGGNFQGVPVTDVKGQMILGFNRPQLDEAIKAGGLTPAKA